MNTSIEFLQLNYFTYTCNQKSFFLIPMYYMIPYQSPNRYYKIFKKWKYHEVFSRVLQQLNLRAFSLLYFPLIMFPIYTVYKQNLLVIWKTVSEKFKKVLDISDIVWYTVLVAQYISFLGYYHGFATQYRATFKFY